MNVGATDVGPTWRRYVSSLITLIDHRPVAGKRPLVSPRRWGIIEIVSFDLYAFPSDGPRTISEVHKVWEAEEKRLLANESDSSQPPDQPGPEMERFIGELETQWPSSDIDPDSSPWATWPLWQPVGRGTALNIVWSHAATMQPAVVALARQCDVIIYDPQSGEVIVPTATPSKRGWFKRRS